MSTVFVTFFSVIAFDEQAVKLTSINARHNKILNVFFIMITVRIKIFVDIKHNYMYYM